MKNIVSLLTVALLTTVFAVGCGKYEKCSQAKEDDCNKPGKFVEGVKCEWKNGKCEDKKDPEPAYDDTADKKVCTDVTLAGTDPDTDKTACQNAKVSADGTKAGKVCIYTPTSGTGTTAVKASCTLGEKQK